MYLCCTQKLLKQLKEDPHPMDHPSGRLATWTCKGVVYQRKRFVLALNRETMLAVVVIGAPGGGLRERLAQGVEAGLRRFGVSQDDAEVEAQLMRVASFAKNSDRSILGSLNDLASSLLIYMDDSYDGSTASLLHLSHKLSQTPHCRRNPTWAYESIDALFETTPVDDRTPSLRLVDSGWDA